MPWVNFPDVDEAEDFSPLPDGEYLCRLTAIDAGKQTTQGAEMWELRFTVEDDNYRSRAIFDRISFGAKALPRIKLLCSRLGLDVSQGLDIRPESIRGRQCFVTVGTETYTDKQGKEREKNTAPYAGFRSLESEGLAMEAAKLAGPHPPNLKDGEDDLPF